MIVRRTREEIEKVLGEAGETQLSSRWPGMSYEQGVVATIDWLLGDEENSPMEDE